jgi:Transposase zinc-binding domain
VRRHYEELEAGGHFTRPVEEQVLSHFLDCRDSHRGFARAYCDHCGHDYLLAFSCKSRYFRAGYHQKRMLAYGEWVEEHVLGKVSGPWPRKVGPVSSSTRNLR